MTSVGFGRRVEFSMTSVFGETFQAGSRGHDSLRWGGVDKTLLSLGDELWSLV